MAKYLLTAPDDDMARWKSRAKELGMSFADFLREAAEAKMAKVSVKTVIVPEDPPLNQQYPVGAGLGKRTFRPDPK